MRFKGGHLTAPLLCEAGGAHGRGPKSGNGFSLVLKVQILEPLVGQSAERKTAFHYTEGVLHSEIEIRWFLRTRFLTPRSGASEHGSVARSDHARSDACSSDASKGADAYYKECIGWVGWWDR